MLQRKAHHGLSGFYRGLPARSGRKLQSFDQRTLSKGDFIPGTGVWHSLRRRGKVMIHTIVRVQRIANSWRADIVQDLVLALRVASQVVRDQENR